MKYDNKHYKDGLLNLGSFHIAKNMYDEPEFLGKVFGDLKFIPIKIEYLFLKDMFELTGLSPYFKLVDRGAQAIGYDIIYGTSGLTVLPKKVQA